MDDDGLEDAAGDEDEEEPPPNLFHPGDDFPLRFVGVEEEADDEVVVVLLLLLLFLLMLLVLLLMLLLPPPPSVKGGLPGFFSNFFHGGDLMTPPLLVEVFPLPLLGDDGGLPLPYVVPLEPRFGDEVPVVALALVCFFGDGGGPNFLNPALDGFCIPPTPLAPFFPGDAVDGGLPNDRDDVGVPEAPLELALPSCFFFFGDTYEDGFVVPPFPDFGTDSLYGDFSLPGFFFAPVEEEEDDDFDGAVDDDDGGCDEFPD